MKNISRQNVIFWASAAVFLGYCLSRIIGRNLSQQDFQIYYYAAQAANLGLDPYNTQELSRLAGGENILPFCYPPAVLWFFRPFVFMPYESAKLVFLGMKSMALMGLFAVWKNYFLKENINYLFYLVCFLGFGSTVYIDLFQGNISIFEQLLLWSAFACFARRKLMMFSALVLCASFFKLVPVFFLGLALTTDHPKRWRYFSVSLAVFFGMVILSFNLAPAHFHSFIQNLLTLSIEDGRTNRSTFLAINGLFAYFSSENHIPIAQPWPYVATLFFGIAVVIFSWRYFKRIGRFNENIIFLACLVYALLIPRFKDYSTILLIIPVYKILLRAPRASYGILLILILLLTGGTALIPLKGLTRWVIDYQPWLLAFICWILLIEHRTTSRGET